MKLVRYNSGRIGVLHDGSVYDATAAFGIDPAAWPPVGMVQAIAKFDATRDASLGRGVELLAQNLLEYGTRTALAEHMIRAVDDIDRKSVV